MAPLSKKNYKLTQIEKIFDLPFCPVVQKITQKKEKKKKKRIPLWQYSKIDSSFSNLTSLFS